MAALTGWMEWLKRSLRPRSRVSKAPGSESGGKAIYMSS
jgi:hypothetical protein